MSNDSEIRKRIIARAKANAKAEERERRLQQRERDQWLADDDKRPARKRRTPDNTINNIAISFPRPLLIIIFWTVAGWGAIYTMGMLRISSDRWWYGLVLPFFAIPVIVIGLMIHYIWVNIVSQSYWLVTTIIWLFLLMATAIGVVVTALGVV